MKQRNYIAILTLAVLCLTGCGKQQEEAPVETKPSIVTKNDVIGGTKAGDEEEKKKAGEALQRGIVSYYTNDVETFVASTDVDVLFTMMNGNAPNETELIASLKERLPVPVYDEYDDEKIIDYTLKETPNERIFDEGTKKLRSLDWLSALEFQKPKKPEEVTVEVGFDKIEYLESQDPLWVFFQGKYYDSKTQIEYIQKENVIIGKPKDNYEIDKAYKIPYVLTTYKSLDDYKTTTKIETPHTGYAVHIWNKNDDEDKGEWKYEIVLENVDAVFGQYLSESGIDETVPENPEPAPEENAENTEGEVQAEADGEANES